MREEWDLLVIGAQNSHFQLFSSLRAFTSWILKILAFSISKSHFITFKISLYNTLNVKTFIFLQLQLNIISLLFFIPFLFLFFLSGLTISLSLSVSLWWCLDKWAFAFFFFFFPAKHLLHYSLFMNSEFRHVISKNFVNSNFFIFYFYCFRFSVFSKINGIQTDPVSTSQSYPPLATSHYNDQRPTSISHHNPTHFLFFLSLSLSPLYLSFSTQRCWPPYPPTHPPIRDPHSLEPKTITRSMHCSQKPYLKIFLKTQI